MAQKLKGRSYDASDLKELMDNVGGWARNWDDVLWFVNNVAVYDADFTRDEVADLARDVEKLKQQRAPFTTDYRQVYKEISGEECERCSPPEGVKSHGINPREMAEKWLRGLAFPASKQAAVQQAKENGAPGRVVEVLGKIKDKQYQTMGSLLESVGDETWDHD